MRVALVGVRRLDVLGGIERHIGDLARAIAEQGNQVTVLSLGLPAKIDTPLAFGPFVPPPFEPTVEGGVKVSPIRVGRARRIAMSPLTWRGVPKLRRFAYGRGLVPTAAWYGRVMGPVIAEQIGDADVVEGFCSDLLATATVSAARIRDIPVVLTPIAHRDEWGTDRSSARAYRQADAVLAMQDTDAQLYRELGVDAGRLHVVGVPVPAVRTGGGASLRQKRGIDGALALYLGRRDAYKGFDVLLEAAGCIEGKVAFVGPGAPLPADLPSNVLDVGPVSTDERDAWLDAADVLVLPSSSETFGAVIVEAWSVRTPVVTSEHPALQRLISDGQGGLAAPARPADLAGAVNSLLRDDDLRKQLGCSGHTYWREHYTPDAVADQRQLIYEGLRSGQGKV